MWNAIANGRWGVGDAKGTGAYKGRSSDGYSHLHVLPPQGSLQPSTKGEGGRDKSHGPRDKGICKGGHNSQSEKLGVRHN